MIDDTKKGSHPAKYESTLSAEVIKASQYRVQRQDALMWARDLRFLTYDDSADNDVIARNEDTAPHTSKKQQCMRCEQGQTKDDYHVCSKPYFNCHKMTQKEMKVHPFRFTCDSCSCHLTEGSRHHCSICLNGDYDICDQCRDSGIGCLEKDHVLEKTRLLKYGDCLHVNARSCEDCQEIPLFPNTGKAKKFKVVKLTNHNAADLKFCNHFIAVSYCWPQSELDEHGAPVFKAGKYAITEPNGRTRQNRAPEEVLDRAITFAAQNGIRLIWIDQECIDQDDPLDKELGIQAMDRVYQRAFLSIGLLDATIESQDALNSMKSGLVINEHWTPDITQLTDDTRKLAESLLGFFEPILDDPWHSRAWILQEAFSAGPCMCLLLKRSPGMDIEGVIGVSKTLSMSEIVIHLDTLSTIMDYATALYSHVALVAPEIDPLTDRSRALLLRLRNFPPGDERSAQMKWTSDMGGMQPRRSCNAAVALSYLQSRENTVVPDRLAIVANLCNFEFRLNTIQAEKNHQSLGACILALALINRDYSLLCPQMYTPGIDAANTSSKATEFSWLSRGPHLFKYIEARILNPFAYYLSAGSEVPAVSEQGISFQGYLWKVNRRIDFSEFQLNNKENWFQARFFSMVCNKLRSLEFDENTIPDLLKTKEFNNMRQEKRSEFHEYVTRKSTGDEQESMDSKRRQILRKFPQDVQSRISIGTKLFLLQIMLFLRSRNEIAVADAIWQSIRSDEWQKPKDIDRHLNSVVDFPPDNELKFTQEFLDDLIQLEEDRNGGYHQFWLIDRVMRDGCLWTGRFVRVSTEDEFTYDPSWLNEEEQNEDQSAIPKINSEAEQVPQVEDTEQPISEALESMVLIEGKSTDESNSVTQTPATEPDTAGEPNDDWEARFAKDLDIQLFKQIFQSSYMALEKDIVHAEDRSELSQDFQNQFITSIMMLQRFNAWAYRKGLPVLKALEAIFDVDRPCLVVTPWDQYSERLPHSESRAMSMSWVVESTGKFGDGTESACESFRTEGDQIKGMWKFLDCPGTVYTLA